MSITSQIKDWISNQEEGFTFCSGELLHLGTRTSIDKTLSRLTSAGDIIRVARGIYSKSAGECGKVESKVIQATLSAISRYNNLPIQVNAETALANLQTLSASKKEGLRTSTKLEKNSEFIWAGGTRKFTLNGKRITIKKVSPRKVALCDRNAGLAVTSIWNLDKGKMATHQISTIINKLPTPDREELLAHTYALPSWASDTLQAPKKQTKENKQKVLLNQDHLDKKWTPSTVEGRWRGFGPYYAMFPVEFARKIIANYCPPGGSVLDPFCGRGTVPFVAMATGREAIGTDINPVAWVYAKVKTDPYPTPSILIERAKAIQRCIQTNDKNAENEFQEYAWTSDILGFLNAARRELDWRNSSVDRTLMGTLLVHLHAKLGDGLSNQLRQSKAMSPNYSVGWWKERSMTPPKIDIIQFLEKKLEWRYQKGILQCSSGIAHPEILLGDNRNTILKTKAEFQADLIFTSPPYYGITNYRYDNWIRLWLLGEGPALPEADSSARHGNQVEYQKLLEQTFSVCKTRAKEEAKIYVRTDARQFTLETTVNSLRKIWPDKDLYFAFDGFKKATQTALFGDKEKKPGEVDLLLIPKGDKPKMEMKPLHIGELPII